MRTPAASHAKAAAWDDEEDEDEDEDDEGEALGLSADEIERLVFNGVNLSVEAQTQGNHAHENIAVMVWLHAPDAASGCQTIQGAA